MGNLFMSTREKLASQRADEIRSDLYARIQKFKEEHRRDFSEISIQKKCLIKKSSASELTELMDSFKVTSVEVVLTFIERAATIGLLNNWVMDQMFDEALATAEEYDRIRIQFPHKKCWRYGDNIAQTYPPFFGVPLSLKQSILVKGKINYVGHVFPINPIPTQENEFIILQKKMGLIPFVRSTVPQANKTVQTNNNITGYAKNPWNDTRSCGGSSGGQGGLVGGYCSPIGIGSDIAGSSRVPCDFTGSVTMKPYYRYTNFGNAFTGSFSSGLPLRSQLTPMTHSVDDVIIWNQFMYDRQNYKEIPRKLKDPYLKLLPFRNNVLKQSRKIKIGYFTDMTNTVKSSPANKRAIYEAVKILQKQGHFAQQIQIPHLHSLWMMLIRLWFSSRKLQLLNECRQGQKPIKEYINAYRFSIFPYFLKVMVAMLIRKHSFKLSQLALSLKEFTTKQYFHLMYQYQVKQKDVYQYLRKKQIDIVLCPTFFTPAYKLGESGKYSYCAGFSPVWSLMHYPAGTVPIMTVNEDELWYTDYQNDSATKAANQGMKEALGLPVGVQIISYPGQQEQVLAIMKQLQQKVCFRTNYHCKTMIADP